MKNKNHGLDENLLLQDELYTYLLSHLLFPYSKNPFTTNNPSIRG